MKERLDPADDAPDRQERLDETIADYIDAMDRGEAPRREELLRQHPDIARELEAFLDDQEGVQRLLEEEEGSLEGPPPAPTTPPGPSLRSGAIFGDYEILGELARGGMGVVYRARHRTLGRRVALKTVLAGAQASEEDRRRFRREAQAAARLDHPNIVPVYDVGEHDGSSFFTMKLAEEGSLAARRARYTDDLRAAAHIVATVSHAVHYAHLHGVLHRDLKPSNIVLDGGQPLVTDFGLAMLFDPDASLTLSGAIVGTPTYMAPEQARGRKELTAAADVYSLGAILYELLTGRPPFRKDGSLETLRALQEEEPQRPSTLRPQVPRDLETIALKCLEKDPRRRYATAAALAEDLERWLAARPIEARRISPIERVGRWCLRNRAVTAALVLLVILVVGATVGVVVLRRSEREATGSLWKAAYSQARNAPYSPEVGHRTESLKAIAEAARIEPSLPLRNAAVACLALGDVELEASLEVPQEERLLAARLGPWAREGGSEASEMLEHVTVDAQGRLRRRRPRDPEGALLEEAIEGASRSLEGWFLPGAAPRFALRSDAGGRQRLRVWDLAGEGWGEPLVDRSGSPLAASSSREGILAVAVGGDVEFTPLDGEAAEEPARLSTGLARILAVAFHPEGRALAVSGWHPDGHGRAQVWDLQSRSLQRDFQLSPLSSKAGALAWHPAGRVLAVSDWVDIVLFDAVAASLMGNLRGHRGEVTRLEFTDDGDVLASQGTDVSMRLWETSSRSLLVTTRSRLLDLGGGDRVATAAEQDGRLERWRIVRRRELRTIRETDLWNVETRSVRFSADESLVALSGQGMVKLVDLRSGLELGSLPLQGCVSADFLADGRLLTWGAEGLLAWPCVTGTDGVLRIGAPVSLDVSAGRAAEPASLDSAGGHVALTANARTRWVVDLSDPASRVSLPEAGSFGRAVLSPDGSRVTASRSESDADSGGEVVLWDARSGEVVSRHAVEGATNVLFAPDGRHLLVATALEHRLHELSSWRCVWSIAREHRGNGPAPAAFLPGGGLVALAASDFHVRLVDVRTASEVCSLPPDSTPIARLVASPSGRWLTVIRFNRVQLWDLARVREGLASLGLDWEGPPIEGRRPVTDKAWRLLMEDEDPSAIARAAEPQTGREGSADGGPGRGEPGSRVGAQDRRPPAVILPVPLQEVRWGTGWDTLVTYRAGGRSYLLAGKPGSGDTVVFRLSADCAMRTGECIVGDRASAERVAKARWSRGWTSVLAYEAGGEPMLLTYKPATGELQIQRLLANGTVATPLAAVRTEAAVGTATVYQDPQGASYLLALRTRTGEARVHPVQASGRFAGAPVWLAREALWWGPGWTHCRSFRLQEPSGSQSFIFLYRRDFDPIAWVLSVGPGGVLGEPVESDIGGGWTIAEPIVTGGGGVPSGCRPLLYLHRASTGESRLHELLPDGTVGAVVATEEWDRGFDRAAFFDPAPDESRGESPPLRLLLNTETGYGRVDRLPEAARR